MFSGRNFVHVHVGDLTLGSLAHSTAGRIVWQRFECPFLWGPQRPVELRLDDDLAFSAVHTLEAAASQAAITRVVK
jgi:hypothetical protein